LQQNNPLPEKIIILSGGRVVTGVGYPLPRTPLVRREGELIPSLLGFFMQYKFAQYEIEFIRAMMSFFRYRKIPP
jgi:hypothetical protein